MEDAFEKLKNQGKSTIDGVKTWIKDGKASPLDETFEKMKKEGKNDVDSLINWLKNAILAEEEAPPPQETNLIENVTTKLIGTAKDAEEKVRKLFEGTDAANVDLAKFKEVVAKIAENQKKNVEEVTKSLAETGPKLVDAFQAGVSAFRDAFSKK